jgi:hypothetical protein
VNELSPEAALQLFRDNCKRPESVPEAVEAHVVQVCGGLPLALLIMAGTLVCQDDEAAWMVSAIMFCKRVWCTQLPPSPHPKTPTVACGACQLTDICQSAKSTAGVL